MLEWFELLREQLANTSNLEKTGAIFGVIQVLLARINHILLYPFGIVSILITIYIFSEVGLYAEAGLNIYYLIMSVYGWLFWYSRSNSTKVTISCATKTEWWLASIITVVGFVIIASLLIHFTDSKVPFLDAWISSTAWAGMWLLAKRKIENWIFLNISNFFAVPLLFYKELPLYALLTVVLFIVAISGYFKWKKIIYNYAY